MDRSARLIPFRALVFFLVAIPSFSLAAQEANPSRDNWRFALTPYVWLPSVGGTLKFGVPPGAGGSPTVESDGINYLEHLDMVGMFSAEARKGDWSIFTDVIYLDFSGENGAVRSVSGPGGLIEFPVNAGTQYGLKGHVWQLAASHVAWRADGNTLEWLGGFRYLGIETSVNWQFAAPISLLTQSGSHSQDTDLWDAIVGVRGRARLGNDWFVPYYLDAGTGDSQLTWQAFTGLGYRFDWGDLLLAYRHLSYDQSGDKLIQDTQFSGPGLAATFRF